MQGILEGEQKNIRVKVLLVIDTHTLALHSEIPLVIRSLIIPQAPANRLRVSYASVNKGDTLCLPQKNPTLVSCCHKAAPAQHILVFCLRIFYHQKIGMFFM